MYMSTFKRFLDSKNLNDQEKSIAEFITKGLSNKEVATQLGLKESEIKKILPEVYQKLEVKTRAQLIVLCLPYLSFQHTMKTVKDDINLKIEHFREKLQLMENLFGGVYVDIDTNRREVHVVGSDNIDVTSIFKIDNLNEFDDLSLDDIQQAISEKITENGFSVISKEEFKKNLGI